MAQTKRNYRYCLKHTNHNGFKIQILLTPIDKTYFPDLGYILRMYCPKCNAYLYFDLHDQPQEIQDHYYEQIKEKNQT